MSLESLSAFCSEHDLGWDNVSGGRFGTYLQLLEQFNAKMNLIGPLSRQAIVDELLVDSVAAAAVAGPTGKILDIGSGAGLPGIPLKILFPDLPITLVEPRKKRSTFLRIVANRLDLEQVTVLDARIEDVELAAHDYVVSKAFRPPADWVETAARYVSARGRVVCLHADDTTTSARAAAQRVGLVEAAHVDDVRDELHANVPPGRSITVFRPR